MLKENVIQLVINGKVVEEHTVKESGNAILRVASKKSFIFSPQNPHYFKAISKSITFGEMVEGKEYLSTDTITRYIKERGILKFFGNGGCYASVRTMEHVSRMKFVEYKEEELEIIEETLRRR